MEMRRLAIRPGAIGDVVVSLPALECLRTHDYEVWTRSETVPLIRFANRVRAISGTGLDLLGVVEPPDPELVRTLARFDSIVSWYGSNRPEFHNTVRGLGLPFSFHPALPPATGPAHAVDFFLRQV